MSGGCQPFSYTPVSGAIDETPLYSLHFDHAADPDDVMAAAAAKTVLTHLGFTNYIVVSGTYGDNYANYVSDSEDEMDVIWGEGNWLNADSAWAASVQTAADAWEATLDAGGDIWIQEAGQSNFSADVVAEILDRQPALATDERIHLIQHSEWNEDETTSADLTYVQTYTDYVKIDDGGEVNDTADFDQDESDWWKNIAKNNTLHGAMWSSALTYFIPRRYEEDIDFSDHVELMHILGIVKATIGDIDDWANAYLVNPSNTFTSETNLKALYNFEDSALTTDSKSTNTLTNNGTATANTDDFKQGLASTELDGTNYYSRTDANLVSGFPGKSGETTTAFSVAAWFKAKSLPSGTDYCLISKYDWGANTRSYHMSIRQSTGTDHHVKCQIGYSSGTSGESFEHTETLSVDTWYFAAFSFNNSTKAWSIRVRDTYGDVVGSDATGTATNNMSITAAPFAIGAFFGNGTPDQTFDGMIDEAMVFSKVLTASEVTNLSKGIYP